MSLHSQAVLDTHDDLIVDLFAGGGGASSGIEEGLGRMVDIAINHDEAAVALHAANHPQTTHHVSDVFEVDPRIATGGRKISLLWASPDCTYHSKARGGKPIRHKNQKRRALAWVVTRWAGQVQPDVIMLENVEEFADWGGLHAKRDRRTIQPAEWTKFHLGQGPEPSAGTGRVVRNDGSVAAKGERTPIEDQCLIPNPKHRTKSFRNWVRSLEAHGYKVEWRELRACDYGAPTIRKRLFVIARRDGRPIVWPEPTHAAPCKHCDGTGRVSLKPLKGRKCLACDGKGVPGGLLPFRTAAECIDWSLPIPSIFLTKEEAKDWGAAHCQDAPKRPLADNTMRRIARGVQRYVLDNPRPYIAPITVGVGGRAGQSPERPGNVPFGTITGKADAGIIAPVITPITHGNPERRTPPPTEPLATITCAHRGEQALIAPYMVPRYGERDGQEPRTRSVEEPAATVVNTGNGDGLVAASLATYHGEKSAEDARGGILHDPLATLDTSNRHAVVASFLAQHNGGFYDERNGAGRPLDKPNGAVCAEGSLQSLVAVHCNTNNNSRDPLFAANEPTHTKVADGAAHNIVGAHLTKFRPGAIGQELTDPAPTVTSNSHNAGESNPGGAAPVGLVAASLAKLKGTATDADPQEPLDTVAAGGFHHAVAATHLQRDFGQSVGSPSDAPIGTLTGGGNGKAALVASFMAKYYGQGTGQCITDPAHTIPTVERLALVTVEIGGQVYVIEDIGMRMLQPRELYLAQGFRPGYIIDQGPDGRKLTKSEQVRMCGNSVSPPIPRALTRANVPHLIVKGRAA